MGAALPDTLFMPWPISSSLSSGRILAAQAETWNCARCFALQANPRSLVDPLHLPVTENHKKTPQNLMDREAPKDIS